MVEAYAQSSEDQLIDGLSFKLGNSASYITKRDSCTFHATGSNVYMGEGAGTKVIRFNLNAENGWLDPSTVRVMFNVDNTDEAADHFLRPLQGPHSFIRRLRISAGGTLLEDINDYNRLHQQFSMLTSEDNRDCDDIEGFGYRSDTVEPGGVHSEIGKTLRGIAPGSSHIVGFKLLSGIFNQPKMIPLKYCPLTVELELVGRNLDPIVDPSTAHVGFTTANTSVSWQLSDVKLKCDIVTLDNSLQNNYDSHLLSGKSLPLNYNTYIVQNQTISGSKVSVNMSRAISRLKSIFVSLYRTPAAGAEKPEDKEWLNFYHPMSTTVDKVYDKSLELEFQVQVGSTTMPQYPITSLSESYAHLKKSIGILGSNFHSTSISPMQYRSTHFMVGIDTEKSLGASWTGLNTRAGDLLTVKMNSGNTTAIAAVQATQMFIVLHSDNVMEISDGGVSVFD